MMDVISIVAAVTGGINLLFLLKLIFSDIKELRKLTLDHLIWHLNGDAKLRQERREP
jgi:hypothetical protein